MAKNEAGQAAGTTSSGVDLSAFHEELHAFLAGSAGLSVLDFANRFLNVVFSLRSVHWSREFANKLLALHSGVAPHLSAPELARLSRYVLDCSV